MDTEINTEINAEIRYEKNLVSARKVCEFFGLRLDNYFPNWKIESIHNEDGSYIYKTNTISVGNKTFPITDDFMGKIAILLGFPWEFEKSMNDYKNQIKENELIMNQLIDRDQLVSEALNKKIDHNIYKITDLHYANKRLEKIIELRNNIGNYMKKVFDRL